MSQNKSNDALSSEPVTLYCESCDTDQEFSFIGEQTWPLAVAEKLNCDPIVQLWRCTCCSTTVTATQPAL